MPILNPPGQGGAITSSTLNLTRVTSMLAGGLGVVTALSGAGARATASGPESTDWAGFDQDQRLVILVVVIAAVVVIHAVDLLARSLATARTSAATVVPLPSPVTATLTNNATNQADHKGQAIAVSPNGRVLFRKDTNNEMTWVPADQITFTGA
ncbi:MAG: hypothetical protein GEV28_36505 [Actinophytocola sp.]|uniref:hypothetical protein n=1 Tax=Actinophytocola sp. TaxID=1872138 RepID=UPI00132B2536|nr:hypothetical protein [Actinophytocola sp.]MPZ85588.1 hypothetical protein [Actinophytocola sp.]